MDFDDVNGDPRGISDLGQRSSVPLAQCSGGPHAEFNNHAWEVFPCLVTTPESLSANQERYRDWSENRETSA